MHPHAERLMHRKRSQPALTPQATPPAIRPKPEPEHPFEWLAALLLRKARRTGNHVDQQIARDFAAALKEWKRNGQLPAVPTAKDDADTAPKTGIPPTTLDTGVNYFLDNQAKPAPDSHTQGT